MPKDLPPDAIVAAPLEPGFLRQCPECERRFALEKVSGEPLLEEGARYLCKNCGYRYEVPEPFDPRNLHLHV